MKAGKQLLYNSLVPSSITSDGEVGQRNMYLERRHDKMACRYYYHATICRLRYDDSLLALSLEFDLGVNQIVNCLKKRLAYINRLVEKEITTSELRRLYPYMDWSCRITLPPQKSPEIPL